MRTRKPEMNALSDVSFKYQTMSLQDMQIKTVRPANMSRPRYYLSNGKSEYLLTERFWGSFCSRFQVGETIFNYYSPDEVLTRISDTLKGDSQVRICMVEQTGKQNVVLALTNPAAPIINPENLQTMLSESKTIALGYNDNGMIRSVHFPRDNQDTIKLGGDSEKFQRRFVMECPVDGYGKPRIFLELLREICTNGAVAMSQSFRTDINIGKNPWPVLKRAIASFDNEDGFSALTSRFEAAQMSPASIHECLRLYKMLLTTQTKLDNEHMMQVYKTMTGNVANMYGLANENVLTDKKQRVLQAKCRVYDLINFASEVATHHAAPFFADRLHAFNGDLVSKDYDLENTAKDKVKFAARFLKAS